MTNEQEVQHIIMLQAMYEAHNTSENPYFQGIAAGLMIAIAGIYENHLPKEYKEKKK